MRAGSLLAGAIPAVSIFKDGAYVAATDAIDVERETDLLAALDRLRGGGELGGIVFEGLTPYGSTQAVARNRLIMRAFWSGIPVVRCGRGATEGFVPPRDPCIAGSNLTSTKARILLMASLMKLGSLPARRRSRQSDAGRARRHPPQGRRIPGDLRHALRSRCHTPRRRTAASITRRRAPARPSSSRTNSPPTIANGKRRCGSWRAATAASPTMRRATRCRTCPRTAAPTTTCTRWRRWWRCCANAAYRARISSGSAWAPSRRCSSACSIRTWRRR